MAVYVDNMNAKYRRMIMSHMIADTSAELFEMADNLHLDRRHIQHSGTYKEHFDICKEYKEKAIGLGAVPITMIELGRIIYKRRPTAKKENS